MRIIAGKFGSRSLSAPAGMATRPMADKVRGAMFDALGDVTGFVVLDVYAGSGAIGLEALSRGASSVDALETGGQAQAVILKNVSELGVAADFHLYKAGVERWLKFPEQQQPAPRYNLITADPPYDKLDVGILGQLAGFLLAGGQMVVSHSSRQPSPDVKSLELEKTKTYGDSALSFYNRSS
ncbi:MAG TPA: 16S rRNA (guanine(966)-N(2))-methyltransferase RsmD [Candidatus Dormibacteraeota bacterium]|nr:16S rRNA (guanine(966)-N(2))-methyltransferase RsmD [Candidatus Dormibacteraeota bacterium]